MFACLHLLGIMSFPRFLKDWCWCLYNRICRLFFFILDVFHRSCRIKHIWSSRDSHRLLIYLGFHCLIALVILSLRVVVLNLSSTCESLGGGRAVRNAHLQPASRDFGLVGLKWGLGIYIFTNTLGESDAPPVRNTLYRGKWWKIIL